jgi:hypothetical protein
MVVTEVRTSLFTKVGDTAIEGCRGKEEHKVILNRNRKCLYVGICNYFSLTNLFGSVKNIEYKN